MQASSSTFVVGCNCVHRLQVVVSTCAGTYGRELADSVFQMVVVDEATQATEPSTLLPLTKGAECFVLAGDHKQLPPTVLSDDAKAMGLETCAFRFPACCSKFLLACQFGACTCTLSTATFTRVVCLEHGIEYLPTL
jgi:AAA domain